MLFTILTYHIVNTDDPAFKQWLTRETIPKCEPKLQVERTNHTLCMPPPANGSAQFHKLHKTTSMSTHIQHHTHLLSDPTHFQHHAHLLSDPTHFQHHAHLLSDPTHLDDIETNVFVEGEEDDESQSIVVPCPVYQQQLDQEPELE